MDPDSFVRGGPFSGVLLAADDGPTLNAGLVAVIFQGIRTCIARKPYIFVIFQGVRTPCPPSGSASSVDSHEMLHFTTIHLVLLYLQITHLNRAFQST